MKYISLILLCCVLSVASFGAVAPITGSLVVCAGSATALADATPGGTWTSAAPDIASVDLMTGSVTGIAAGTARITYMMTPIDYTTKVVTVNPLPGDITGVLQICTGFSTTLSSSPAGGTWTSGIPALASIGSSSGIATGIVTGNTYITYTLPTGCMISTTLTVNQTPLVFGTGIVCLGSPATLTSTATGGTWTSSNPLKATVDLSTGVVTGVALGTAVITMTLPTGCYSTITETVNPATTPISGTATICNGSGTLLTNTTTGGTWSSSNTGVAIIGSVSGALSAMSPGTSTITYKISSTGCYATRTQTVNGALPISGAATLCDGLTTVFTDPTPGGSWSSSNTVVATVGSSTGIVTGISSGTALISYTVACGTVVKLITITSTTPPITGVPSVCIGLTTPLGDAATGGTWSSSNTSIAAVNSGTGLVTGVSAGTASIYYNTGSCGSVNVVVTVNPLPDAIAGAANVCVGATTLFTNTATGGTWSSINPAIAGVDATTGVVSGLTTGGATIVYTLPTGCTRNKTIVVNAIAAISGNPALCVGGFSAFTVVGPSGTWSSSNPAKATVSAGGVVSGISLGTATISYTVSSSGCAATQVVTVSSLCTGMPVAGSAQASSSVVCSGNAVTLSLTGATLGCGVNLQWQSSPDGSSWTNISGATTPTYLIIPTATRFYRCRFTCVASTLVAFSTPVVVVTNYKIATHSEINTPSAACGAVDFFLTACGVSSTFSVKTYFGDATSATTALTPTGISNAHVLHNYTLPGTYTIKHVLYNSGIAVDSITFSYEYLYCKTFSVQFYNDLNSNCAFDAGDTYNINPLKVEIDSNGYAIDTMTITSALYRKVYGPAGTVYGFRFISGTGGMSVSCPSSGILYDTVGSLVNNYPAKYFGLSCPGIPAYDLSVKSSIVCDQHSAHGNITVSNSYCTPVSPVVTMTFSNDYVFSGALPVPTTVSGNTVTWNLGTVSASAARNITVYLDRASSLPTLPLGDTINSTISVGPVVADVNTANNVIHSVDTVRAFYAPNEITVFPAGHVLPCTQLEYRIRFENTGFDTAHNVTLLDTLAPELDPSTLDLVSASAPVKLSVINDGVRNIARFDFPQINLLDSTHHGQSDGMISYSVKLRNSLTDGTAITNHAGVIFDDYPVALTNDAVSIIGIGAITGAASVCTGLSTILWSETPDGVWSGSTTIATISGDTVLGLAAGTVNVTYTVTNGCTSRTTTRVLDVNPSVVPSLSISASTPDTVCAGTSTIFTASPVDAGMSATFDWKVNGASLGTGSLFIYAPVDSDVITVVLATDTACAVPDTLSDSLMMTVINTGLPEVAISVSPSSVICAGNPVTFTATPTLGGDLPGFIWTVNGAPVATGTTYTYIPANGDVVYNKMGSNFMCRLADTVVSPNITITADAPYVPLITILVNPGLIISPGQYDTLTAIVTDAGPSPTYQWMVNGVDVPGATSPTFISNTFADYDSVTCNVTGSGTCAITAFKSVYLSVYNVGVASINKDMLLGVFPNPNKGGFHVKGFTGSIRDEEVTLEITDMLGQVVYTKKITAPAGKIDEAITLSNTLANGMYMLNLHTLNASKTFHFVLEQ